MKLSEWFKREGSGSKTRLQLETGLAYTTILRIEAGTTTPRAKTAKAIEEATGGVVTAAELLGVEAA